MFLGEGRGPPAIPTRAGLGSGLLLLPVPVPGPPSVLLPLLLLLPNMASAATSSVCRPGSTLVTDLGKKPIFFVADADGKGEEK